MLYMRCSCSAHDVPTPWLYVWCAQVTIQGDPKLGWTHFSLPKSAALLLFVLGDFHLFPMGKPLLMCMGVLKIQILILRGGNHLC